MSSPYNYSGYQPQSTPPVGLLIPLAYLIQGALFLAIVAQIIFVLTGSFGYDRDGDGVPLR